MIFVEIHRSDSNDVQNEIFHRLNAERSQRFQRTRPFDVLKRFVLLWLSVRNVLQWKRRFVLRFSVILCLEWRKFRCKRESLSFRWSRKKKRETSESIRRRFRPTNNRKECTKVQHFRRATNRFSPKWPTSIESLRFVNLFAIDFCRSQITEKKNVSASFRWNSFVFTSCKTFFSILINECRRSWVLVSDGLATFRSLSRTIRSNCKSLRKNCSTISVREKKNDAPSSLIDQIDDRLFQFDQFFLENKVKMGASYFDQRSSISSLRFFWLLSNSTKVIDADVE